MSDNEQIDQIHIAEENLSEPPKVLWATALGRAHFGFRAETHRDPSFVNDHYLHSLAEVENQISQVLGKIVLWSFLFSLFTITSANNALGEASFQGFSIARVPHLTEFCVLVLGVLISAYIIFFLDMLTVTRMRFELFSISRSEVPHMRMVHFKRAHAFMDTLTPKHMGYSSGLAHKTVQRIGLVWAMLIPASIISVMIAAQLIASWDLLTNPLQMGLGTIVSLAGLALSSASVFVFILIALVPLRFKWRE